jgi:Na+-driven multidrug efflux pump
LELFRFGKRTLVKFEPPVSMSSYMTLFLLPDSVHTIAYNLVPLLFMVPLGIMIGLQVRIGHVIGYNVKKAKLLAAWCMLFTTTLGAFVALLLFQFRVEIAMLFTNDEEVIQGCYYIFILYIFGINSAILRALGMQWHMAAIVFACIWLGTLPTLVFFAIRRGGGIDAVWSTLPVFHTVMQVLLAWSYLSSDWTKIGKEIRDHALESVEFTKQPSPRPTEHTRLLVVEHACSN